LPKVHVPMRKKQKHFRELVYIHGMMGQYMTDGAVFENGKKIINHLHFI
jgi:hypothetical protein